MVQGKLHEAWEQEFLRLSYEWEKIHAYGDCYSMCTDGVILNQIRQELLEIKQKLEDAGNDSELKIPPKMQAGYIAGEEQIRTQAQSAVQKYLAMEEYRYILITFPRLTQRQKQDTRVWELIGKVQSLVDALAEDNLVVLREFGKPGMLTEFIADTAEKLRSLPLKSEPDLKKEQKEEIQDWQIQGQMSIYDLAVS